MTPPPKKMVPLPRDGVPTGTTTVPPPSEDGSPSPWLDETEIMQLLIDEYESELAVGISTAEITFDQV